MNKYDNFFNNLFPLRPLYPFVQSVLPTVFDDSLSYLETLGKVIKALNDTESNVNSLEQAVRAFADDLALYGNLTISPVEITYNQETGRYSASMTYADIVSAIQEGHTMVMQVVDGLHNAEYYTATMKVAETGNGVKVLYWESPAFTVNDVTVFYEPFINENDVAGVTTRTITGGSDAFIIHYNSDTETADKTFAEIVAAIEAEKPVMLIADHFFISDARWTTSGNDELGYEIISVQFNAFNVVSVQNGKNLGCVTYAVNNADTWTVTRDGFPNESRVNALIEAQLDGLEMLHAVQYTAQELNNFQKAQARNNIAAGHYNIGVSADETLLTLVNLETNSVETYNINKGAPFIVTVINPTSNVFAINRTAAEIRENIKNLRLLFGDNEGVVINSYRIYDASPMHNIVFTVADPENNSVSYVEFVIQVYYEGMAPTSEDDVPIVTRNLITHNITGGGGSAYQIPVSVSGGVYTTTATGANIFDNLANCFAVVNGVCYYPVGAFTSGPFGNVYLAAVDPHTPGSYDVEILQFTLNGADAVATVQRYSNDINSGNKPRVSIAADSASIPALSPNTLYVFTGDAAALSITLAAPTNNNVENEYHFIFNSGSTPTTLTLPNTIRQPDGFTIEANHVYEVSILENNMTAQGWAVTA